MPPPCWRLAWDSAAAVAAAAAHYCWAFAKPIAKPGQWRSDRGAGWCSSCACWSLENPMLSETADWQRARPWPPLAFHFTTKAGESWHKNSDSQVSKNPKTFVNDRVRVSKGGGFFGGCMRSHGSWRLRGPLVLLYWRLQNMTHKCCNSQNPSHLQPHIAVDFLLNLNLAG